MRKKSEEEERMEKEGNEKLWWKSIFSSSSKSRRDAVVSPDLPFLTPLANSVISRCSKILGISGEELQHLFDGELPDTVKQPPLYARNFLEFCSYKALHLAITLPHYLNDKEFRRLTFDMMIAWEDLGVDSSPPYKVDASFSNQDVEDEDGWSLFYSNSTKMAVQVDDKKTVGSEAFARIAPACPVIADIITVYNLFDVLTSISGPRLHYLIYDKYLRNLEKVMKSVQNAVGAQLISNLSLADDEIVLDIDGTVPPSQCYNILGCQHGQSGVGLYDKAVKYDLATDLKQVIKPELTGPLGARLFDKAVMYKSTATAEPVYLEFPEFKGCSRRDYWLDMCLEILRAHRFIRKYNMKETQQSEALARAVLGIFRNRAVREAFDIFPSNYKTVLCFNLAESLPGGYMIMETLSSRLSLISASAGQNDMLSSPNAKRRQMFPFAIHTLCRLGIISSKDADMNSEGDVYAGESNPLEIIMKQLKMDTGRAEAAQATVDQVKVEGIDTNLAVMKELLSPLIGIVNRLRRLASWEDPYKSVMFVLLFSYMILKDWIKYLLPSIFVFLALVMFWRRNANKRRHLEAFKIVAPPSKNAVEQLLTLQEAITQVESLIQSGNIILLKLRALLFAAAPQATDRLSLLLVVMGMAFVLLPMKYVMFLVFLECFTRSMPLRRESTERGVRRLREWWKRIPAAPVQLIKPDDKKRK